jgi:hypothetical protein
MACASIDRYGSAGRLEKADLDSIDASEITPDQIEQLRAHHVTITA